MKSASLLLCKDGRSRLWVRSIGFVSTGICLRSRVAVLSVNMVSMEFWFIDEVAEEISWRSTPAVAGVAIKEAHSGLMQICPSSLMMPGMGSYTTRRASAQIPHRRNLPQQLRT